MVSQAAGNAGARPGSPQTRGDQLRGARWPTHQLRHLVGSPERTCGRSAQPPWVPEVEWPSGPGRKNTAPSCIFLGQFFDSFPGAQLF